MLCYSNANFRIREFSPQHIKIIPNKAAGCHSCCFGCRAMVFNIRERGTMSPKFYNKVFLFVDLTTLGTLVNLN